MNRTTISFATLLLVIAAASGCDYSAPSGVYTPPPPDTTFADGLWTASGAAPGILRLSSPQLGTSANITPATIITSSSASLSGFNGIAFDADGTLWMTSQLDSLLLAFRRPSLTGSGHQVASRVILPSNESLTAPSALAFDAAHGLWVANSDNGTLVHYDAAQLTSGGRLVPTVILSGVGHPTGLAFDAAGGLWFSDGSAHRVAKYSAAQLGTSGRKLPDVVLSSNGPDITNPIGLAFDAEGTLWMANSGLNNIVAIRANHLGTTASVHADIAIKSASAASLLPLGVAFDEHGNLWVQFAEGVIAKYDHAVLAASGAPEPAVRLTIDGRVEIRSAAFWPRPAGLPLN